MANRMIGAGRIFVKHLPKDYPNIFDFLTI